MKKILFLLICLSLFTACSMNKAFLKPQTFNSETESTSFYIQGDSVEVHFQGAEHQPLYVRNNTDTVQFDYKIESVMFASTSKNKINGWWLTPRSIQPKITLIYFHGNSGSLPLQHFAMSKLARYGIQIFAIDYSGYGFSEGKAKRKSVLNDGNSTVNYVLNNTRVKGTKVLIYGQSLGGNLAGVVAAENNNKIDGLIIEGGFSSHKDIASRFAGFIGRWVVKEQYSAAKAIANFYKPVLIIHSTEDDVVPFEEGQKTFANANEPKEFYKIDGCHICGSRIYGKEIAEKIFKMVELPFSENLPEKVGELNP